MLLEGKFAIWTKRGLRRPKGNFQQQHKRRLWFLLLSPGKSIVYEHQSPRAVKHNVKVFSIFFLFIAILITTFFSTSPLTDIINQGLVLTFRRGGGGGKEEIWLCPNKTYLIPQQGSVVFQWFLQPFFIGLKYSRFKLC